MKRIEISASELNSLFCESDGWYASAIGELTARKLTVSTAESCTGGLIGKMFTDVSGASAAFVGGMMTYTNHIKINKLGVRAETINAHTEVSYECACEMAERARELFESDLAIAATGYAGPAGGNERDAVGTVYLGIASPESTTVWRLSFGQLPRDTIRNRTALFAVKALLEVIEAK
jgi:nicotinamide-nucleotide amidase